MYNKRVRTTKTLERKKWRNPLKWWRLWTLCL
jgi:hypothetical protein